MSGRPVLGQVAGGDDEFGVEIILNGLKSVPEGFRQNKAVAQAAFFFVLRGLDMEVGDVGDGKLRGG